MAGLGTTRPLCARCPPCRATSNAGARDEPSPRDRDGRRLAARSTTSRLLIAFITIRSLPRPYTLIVREVSVSVILTERALCGGESVQRPRRSRDSPAAPRRISGSTARGGPRNRRFRAEITRRSWHLRCGSCDRALEPANHVPGGYANDRSRTQTTRRERS